MQRKREREDAIENLQALKEEKQRLELQFQTEVNMLDAKTNPIIENLENIIITPAKTNIMIRLVALIWSPN